MDAELKIKIEEMAAAIPVMGSKQGVSEMDALFAQARQLATTPEERAAAGEYLRALLADRKKKGRTWT